MGIFSKIVSTAAIYTVKNRAIDGASNLVAKASSKAEEKNIIKRKKLLESCPPGQKGLILSWDNDATVDEIEVSDASGEIIYYIDSDYYDSGRNLRIFDLHGNIIAYIIDRTGKIIKRNQFPLYIGNQQVGTIEAKYKHGEQEFITSDGIRIFKGKKDKEFHIFIEHEEIGKIIPKGMIMNLKYIVTFPDDAPDMMFLLIALVVYIFNAGRKTKEDFEDRRASAYIHRDQFESHIK